MNTMRGNTSGQHELSPWRLTVVAFALGLLVGPAHAATVVTNEVVSQSQSSQENVPVSFGQVFKAGDVPKGKTVSAMLDGRLVPLQVDVKATNPDGSLRHAVLTAMLTSLGGGTTESLTIAATAPSVP